MIKRIRSEQLRPGMYISDLNCGWLEHTFAFNAFRVKDEATIRKILANGIREVYIDTAIGADVADAQTQAEVDADIHAGIVKVAEAVKPPPPSMLRDEIVVARQVHSEANQVVHDILTDVRLGKQIKVEQAEPVVEHITESIFRNKDALSSLSRIKQKDNYTFQHSVSVCALLVSFAHSMGYAKDDLRALGIGGLLHDIGKMKVPDVVLNKPATLTPPELVVMQSHAALGREILKHTDGIPEKAILVTGQHHERYDGTGYPDKLKEGAISDFGQMASIVDVYDALTSNRVYHRGMEPTAALKKLFEWSKFHFNEQLVEHFIRVIGIYPVSTLVALESGALAVVVQQGEKSLLAPIVRVVFDTEKGYVAPHDVDLAKGNDRIVNHEIPRNWGIDPFEYL